MLTAMNQMGESINSIRPPQKIGVFRVCRPTLFDSCRPYHFSPKIKKRDRFPVLLERSWILVPVFKFFAGSILFGIQSNLLRIPSDFVNPRWRRSHHFSFKKMWSPRSEKLVWSNKSSPDDLRYLITTIHAMTSFFFGFISLFCCLMLYQKKER